METSFDHLLSTPKLVGATWDLALSYDHRVIDGATGARFSTALVKALADVARLAD